MVKNKIIKISPAIVEKYRLPTNEVVLDHIHHLFKLEESNMFKLAPKLRGYHFEPNNFEKMRVSTAYHIAHPSVAAALMVLASNTNDEQFVTTAWFIDTLSNWYKIVTSRHPDVSLSYCDVCMYRTH